jgi:hypothetical protein
MMSEKAQKYFDRYSYNLALAAEIENLLPRAGDWICVLRFYAALHLINAYLVDKVNIRFDPESTEHKERKRAMAQCPELRDAPEKYRRLKDLSEDVRYKVNFKFADQDGDLAMSLLTKIVAIVEPKLKKA